MSLIRGTALQGFSELVEELGGDPGALLRAERLQPSSVGDPDAFLPYRGVVAVLEAAARSTGTPDLGRRLGARQGTEILGPLGVAARTAPDVGAALAAIEKYMVVYSPAIAVSVRAETGDSLATFEWRLLDPRAPAHSQSAELALAVSCRVFRLLAGDDFRPTSVQFRHRPLGEASSYLDFFGCPVQHAADRDGFRFPAAVLGRPVGSDGAVHALVAHYLASVVTTGASRTSHAVASLVRRTLPVGVVDLDLVAEQLSQHPRTLQRRLADEGTSFVEVVDDVRRHEAERYLRDTDMPLAQLAGLLGFSEQSALTRACRRWFGSPPSQVRKALGVH